MKALMNTMRSFGIVAAGGAMALSAAAPAFAHHSGAMFDAQKTVVVDATVKEFQWTNPHSWVQIVAPDAKGGTSEWGLELGPLVGLQRSGWKPKTLQPGDKVKVSFHPMKDGQPGGSLVSVTFPDGRVLTQNGGFAPAARD